MLKGMFWKVFRIYHLLSFLIEYEMTCIISSYFDYGISINIKQNTEVYFILSKSILSCTHQMLCWSIYNCCIFCSLAFMVTSCFTSVGLSFCLYPFGRLGKNYLMLRIHLMLLHIISQTNLWRLRRGLATVWSSLSGLGLQLLQDMPSSRSWYFNQKSKCQMPSWWLGY